jgi:SlyX protein
MPEDIERRLVDLEVKASYTDDLADELNRCVTRQQQQIDALIRELARLRQQVSERTDPAAADGSGLPAA